MIKVQKFGPHSVAHEITEDLEGKEATENSNNSNAKGFKCVVSCAKKKYSRLLFNQSLTIFLFKYKSRNQLKSKSIRRQKITYKLILCQKISRFQPQNLQPNRMQVGTIREQVPSTANIDTDESIYKNCLILVSHNLSVAATRSYLFGLIHNWGVQLPTVQSESFSCNHSPSLQSLKSLLHMECITKDSKSKWKFAKIKLSMKDSNLISSI